VQPGWNFGAKAARRLARHRLVEIAPGLTEAEFARLEQQFGFEFADDHRGFLATGLPLGDSWPNWRTESTVAVRALLAGPVEGVLFDVRHSGFWHAGWGARPAGIKDALVLAAERLAGAPAMVPVYSHRYLPAGRGGWGHPVLSMYQTDIIVSGLDLLDYLYQEFHVGPGIERADPDWRPAPTVPFWSDLVS
jgi:hypothetical protein